MKENDLKIDLINEPVRKYLVALTYKLKYFNKKNLFYDKLGLLYYNIINKIGLL